MGLRPTLTKQISHSAQIRVFWCFCVTYKPVWMKHLLSPHYQRVEEMGAKTKKMCGWNEYCYWLHWGWSWAITVLKIVCLQQIRSPPKKHVTKCKKKVTTSRISFLFSTRRANNVILPQAVFPLKDTTLNATLIFRHFWGLQSSVQEQCLN